MTANLVSFNMNSIHNSIATPNMNNTTYPEKWSSQHAIYLLGFITLSIVETECPNSS